MRKKVDLVELVRVIFEYKWIIVGVTLVAVFVAALASFVWIKPVYSVRATVSVNNGLTTGKPLQETDVYFNEMLTPTVYMEYIKSPQVIEEAVEQSGLQHYNVSQVQSNLLVENPQNTNLINITLKASNPADAKKLLDSILSASKEMLLKEMRDRVKSDNQKLMMQVKLQKEELQRLLKDYYQKAQKWQLPVPFLLDSAVSDNSQYIVNLDSKYLENKNNIPEKDLIALGRLMNEIKTSASVYRECLSKQQQLSLFLETLTIDNKITTLSEPVEPKSQDSPDPLFNIIVAVIIGVASGVGVVFLWHYLKKILRG
ncbi:Wzz/FepE/Etk N-terminal domain-containing protein [Anoxybacillus geothermalis]|uniref:YveK family protein n=1 Tax=Geobacillus jurassicus TaxID=235932 RepID=A0ABV6GS74_9BACL|nr:Wzz/FepE/Etk N-terminal domain-containing protein [Geobacillus jurassicus]MED5073948.1 Wzz/FepE/Etk N-terminal domain-containing protein [Anoxybacillus geothermalis]WJQ00121.1 Wzz/FepE/Etk N-terminal domain-containing protein [Geobacillus stearothermophilus]WJQ03508.1 Wzz/FepE/Etk N-terminal domain-containing protein [Geobacillus stearothermophilus]